MIESLVDKCSRETIAIMQPYFFPYLGYFQLMDCADLFVLYDDVQYIKQAWLNRNRILRDGEPVYLTLPVVGGSHRELICERRLFDVRNNLQKALAQIHRCYRSAPRFSETMRFLEPLFLDEIENLSAFNIRALNALRSHLGISTQLVIASERQYGRDVAGQDRVIRICKTEAMSHYVNAIGALTAELYSEGAFMAEGLTLSFLKSSPDISYSQGTGHFIPNLSIIDVLMFNALDRVREMLSMYTLEKSSRAQDMRFAI